MKKDILKAALIFLFAIPLSFISCEENPDEDLPKEPVHINLTEVETNLVGSGNDFAFDIFRKVLENEIESKNVMISPLSISYALSMTVNGADGTTREAMLEALRVNGITVNNMNEAYKELTKALLSVDKRVIISIANSVWTEKDFAVKQQFIDILTNYYDAESRSFYIDDKTVPDQVNGWIEDKTNGLIKDMIDELDPNAIMLLINAIYFKGKWKFEFDKDDTSGRPFYMNTGSSSSIPTMYRKGDVKVYVGNGFKIGEFPYGQGNYVMDIILPDTQNGLPELLPSITDEAFTGWISQLNETETEVYLPRFKYGYKKLLNEILSDMGMGIAFSDFADFTNIAETPPLQISRVLHQSFIETNEEGTEAAAVTVVEIRVTSAPSTFLFKADHPFIYIIREVTTGSILFMGRVADPSAE